jgi:hypothetical protein
MVSFSGGAGSSAMSPKDREILEGSGGTETGRAFRDRTGQRATRSDRALPGTKARRGREREAERVQRETGAGLKMQAGNVDTAAGVRRKAGHRRRRAKGRIEDQASIGMKRGRAPERRSGAG